MHGGLLAVLARVTNFDFYLQRDNVMQKGMTIDYETADRITLLNLKDQLSTLEKEVTDHVLYGKYMHPEDLQEALNSLLPALRVLIKYYGGSVDE